jgi:hypothetical protein
MELVMRYWLGVDFGQANDPTAVSVVERVPTIVGEREVERKVGIFSRRRENVPVHDHELHVRSLVRPPLRTSYERIADEIGRKIADLEPVGAFGERGEIGRKIADLEPVGAFGERGEIGLCVDATGVGRALCDMLSSRLKSQLRGPKVHLWPVVVTGGNRVTRLGGEFIGVPKRDLISAGLIALQDGRLKIPTTIPETEVLKQELLDYRVRITLRSGHDTYEPWREGDHDDLLFAVCLSVWAWSFTESRDLLPAS